VGFEKLNPKEYIIFSSNFNKLYSSIYRILEKKFSLGGFTSSYLAEVNSRVPKIFLKNS